MIHLRLHKIMKEKFLGLLIIISISSCFNNTNIRPTSSTETGTAFIRATLDGNFKDAETLLLKDDQNTAMFESYKTFYNRLPAEKKQAYKQASYIINTLTEPNDSTTIINYSNSYMKQPMAIKIIKRNNAWSVDFKYTSSDTSSNKRND
jgi:hypothetical protein